MRGGCAMRNTLLLTWLALYSAACATSSPKTAVALPPVKPSIASPATQRPTTALDAEEFRRELESVYTQILARNDSSKPPVHAPVVDIEAAASIPIPEHR